MSLNIRNADLLSYIRAPWLYENLKEPAEGIKVLLQMIVGVVGVIVVLVAVLRDALGHTNAGDASKHALVLISVSLAVAASLELAYTLFTPGPDEAIDLSYWESQLYFFISRALRQISHGLWASQLFSSRSHLASSSMYANVSYTTMTCGKASLGVGLSGKRK